MTEERRGRAVGTTGTAEPVMKTRMHGTSKDETAGRDIAIGRLDMSNRYIY
jgi:hypothetical protein